MNLTQLVLSVPVLSVSSKFFAFNKCFSWLSVGVEISVMAFLLLGMQDSSCYLISCLLLLTLSFSAPVAFSLLQT